MAFSHRLRSSRVAGLADQALASLVTFGQTLVYARTLAAEEFGLFAMALAAVLVAQILQRTVVVLPMIVAQSEHSHTAVHAWWRVNAAVLGLTMLAVVSIGMLAHASGARSGVVVPLCVAVATALPSILVYEFVRRTLYVQQRKASVLGMSAAHFVLQALGVAVVVRVGGGAWAAMVAVALAAGAAAVVGAVGLDRTRAADAPGARMLLRRYRSDMGWSLAAAVPYAGFNTALPVLLGLLSGPAAAGVFTATRLLLAPITTLISAVDSVDKPRAARRLRDDGTAGLKASLLRTVRSLLLLGGGYLLAAGVWAQDILRLLLGADYPLDAGRAWLWLVVGLLMMLGQPLETGMLVMRLMRLYFWTRFAALVVGMLTLVATLHRLGYESGILAMGTAWLVSGTLAALLLARALRADGAAMKT
jgi:O-antigen/teichoic acid export membrane protein